MRTGLALLLLSLPLAGCTVEPPVVERGPSPTDLLLPGADGNLTENATLLAPVPWEVGMWWRFREADRSFEQVASRIVTGDQGSAWLVETDNAEIAYYDALIDYSTIGRVRKADLAAEERGGVVDYYRWPLVENATWSAAWDDDPLTVTVLGPQLAQVAGRSYPAIALEARAAGVPRVRYNYVPAVAWFSYLEFIEEAAGGGSYRLDLQSFGRNYTGPVVQAQASELYRDMARGPLKTQGSFIVPAGAAFLDVDARFTGDNVAYDVTFVPPAGQGGQAPQPYRATAGPCTANCSINLTARLNGTQGEWRVTAAGTVQGGVTPASAMLHVWAATISTRRMG